MMMGGEPHRRFFDWSDKQPGPYPRKYPADPKKGCRSVFSNGLLIAIYVLVMAILLVGCSDGCPKGQHLTVISYYPVVVGKVVTVQPIYGCR